MALGDERNCLGVWISQFRICRVWEYVCNPQRKTTLRKQPHDRLWPLYDKAGVSHLVRGFQEPEIFSNTGKKRCFVYDSMLMWADRHRKDKNPSLAVNEGAHSHVCGALSSVPTYAWYLVETDNPNMLKGLEWCRNESWNMEMSLHCHCLTPNQVVCRNNSVVWCHLIKVKLDKFLA